MCRKALQAAAFSGLVKGRMNVMKCVQNKHNYFCRTGKYSGKDEQ
jgi:hypothetical protein